MALPGTINSATPVGTDLVSEGDNQLRDLKLYLVDVLGFPDNTAVTAAALSVSAAGVVVVQQNSFRLAGVGPHAIGGVTNADVGLLITGVQPTGAAMGVQIASTTTPATGESSYGINLIPTLTEFSSGVHALLAGMNIAPVVTAGVGTVTTLAGLAIGALTAQTGTTNAAAVYISEAPTGATNNFALWVVLGMARLQNLQVAGTINVHASASTLTFSSFANVELMRLTDTGILAIGTTVTTGAAAGGLAANGAFYRLNAAGTSHLPMIDRGAGDELVLLRPGATTGSIVTLGAVDSGGAGFRLLRMAN